MRIIIGSLDDRGHVLLELPELREAKYLSEQCIQHVATDDTIHLPWPLALLMRELFDDDGEREAELTRRAPPWATPDDLDILMGLVLKTGLPRPAPYKLKLRASGLAGKAGYNLRTVWTDDSGRKLRTPPSVEGGFVLTADGTPRRLTLGQYELLRVLSTPPELGQDRPTDLLFTARAKASVPTGDGGVIFDTFLAKERAVSVPKVAPRLVRVGNGFQVRPAASELPAEVLDDHYYNAPRDLLGSGVLVARDADGTRTRAVFGDDVKAGLQRCRELDVLTPDQAAQAMSHPEEFFGPSLDLSAFSERVTGLGPAVRRVLPMLKETSGKDWWDWDAVAELESVGDEDAPTITLSLDDDETRRLLGEAIEQADKRGDVFIPDPSGEGMIEVTPRLREAIKAAEELSAAKQDRPGKPQKRAADVLLVSENIEDIQFDRSSGPGPVQRPRLGPPPEMQTGMALKPHQVEGYEWLVGLFGGAPERRAWQGALLADDMGLGKTLQVLAFLSWANGQGRRGPHLIVAPVALIENWQREARVFFGGTLEPMFPVRGRDLPSDRQAAVARLGAQRLVLVSYETLRRKELIFGLVKWDLMVLDEAQKAKDPSTQIHRVVCAMDARARLAVTGTPVENTLKELWAMYHWAAPGLLGSLVSFNKEVIKPLKKAASEERESVAKKVHDSIAPVFMRRMKQAILSDLPPIHHSVERVAMSHEQVDIYSSIVSSARDDGKGALGRLIRLFGVCAHPHLQSNAGELPSIAEVTFPKVERLFQLLDDIAQRQEKALVFANRHKLQWWLANEIERRYGAQVDIINGQVSNSTARLKIIDDFGERSGFGALVLAPRAAGVGLNITPANHIIHYTREWNPAVENQATDRAYRMGQTREVHVHYMVAESMAGKSVEVRLDELLTEKRALMDQFVVPMGGFDLKARDFDQTS